MASAAPEGKIHGVPKALESREAVVTQLERILASRLFATAPRLSRFLRYVVEKRLAGEAQEIKEYSIAIEVYDRKPDYDPQVDSTVRGEASRLRKRLAQYYESTGDQLTIKLPVGSYVPVFEWREAVLIPTPAPPAGPPSVVQSTRRRIGIGLLCAAVVVAAAAVWLHRSRSQAPAALQSIAVLPFVSLGADPQAEKFSDGLTEEVTARLGGLEGLRVPARSLMSPYKAGFPDLIRLGKTLGVSAFLEGSVRSEQNRVLVTARLIDARDGYHLWSESFDRTDSGRLAIERDIGQRIASAIEDRALGRQPLRSAGRVEDPEVMTAYLRAYELLRKQTAESRHLWPAGVPPDLLESIELFKKATSKSPGFAKAWVGLAEAHELVFELDRSHPVDRLAGARAALQQAIRADGGLADAYNAQCSLLLYRVRDFTGAEAACRRAIELNPRDVTAQQRYINLLRIQGRSGEARSEMARALQLQPTAPGLRVQNSLLLFDENRFAESIAEAAKAESLNPGREAPHYPMAAWMQGQNHEQKREFATAEQHYRRGLAAMPFDRWCEPALARILCLTGRAREAEPMLRRLQGQRARGNPVQLALALSYAAMNRNAEALDLLEEGFRSLDPSLLFLRVEKRLNSLASEPRYQALLTRVSQTTHFEK